MLIRLVKNITASKLLKNNAVFFVGAVATGALNYALYPAISRFVSVQEFGEIQVLLSIILQLSIIFNIVRIFVISVVSNEEDDTKNAVFLLALERTLLIGGIALSALFLALAPLLKDFLQFKSITPFIPLALSYLVNFQFTTRIGYIHAKKDFVKTSLLQSYQAGSKLFFAVTATALGFGVGGVMWAIAIATGTLLLLTRKTSKDLGLSTPKTKKFIEFSQLKILSQHKNYLLLVGVVAGCMAFLLSIDSIIVKSQFDPETAGQYAAIAVVARTIFFITASVSGVLLASIKLTNSLTDNARTFLVSVALVMAAGLACLGAIALFPDQIVTKLIGAEFGEYSPLLVQLSAAVLCISFVNLVLYYHLALRDYWISVVAIAGSTITLLFVLLNHDTLELLVSSFLVGTASYMALAIVWSLGWHLKRHRHQINEKTTS